IRRPAIYAKLPQVLAPGKRPHLALLDFRVTGKSELDHACPTPLSSLGLFQRLARHPDRVPLIRMTWPGLAMGCRGILRLVPGTRNDGVESAHVNTLSAWA